MYRTRSDIQTPVFYSSANEQYMRILLLRLSTRFGFWVGCDNVWFYPLPSSLPSVTRHYLAKSSRSQFFPSCALTSKTSIDNYNHKGTMPQETTLYPHHAISSIFRCMERTKVDVSLYPTLRLHLGYVSATSRGRWRLAGAVPPLGTFGKPRCLE